MVERTEWYRTEQEAIALLKQGVPIERVNWQTHLDMFWLRMMQEKLARNGEIKPVQILQRKQ
jgi:GH35 family endo-1,4-beta-xylanase